jgi:uncharacterized membrane protein YcaP (DUF421 family)
MNIAQIDWKSVFSPTVPLAEVFLRGTLTYLFVLIVLRLLRREAGALSISDLLVVVLIADAAQNAMAAEYKSITEGMVLIATIASWDYFLDWLSYRVPSINRLVHGTPLLLIKNGRLQWQNMKREMITEEELMGQLREQGVETLEEVKKSYLEGDGHVSVIRRSSNDVRSSSPRKKGVDEG